MALVNKDAEQITFEGEEALLAIAMLNHFSLNGFPEGLAGELVEGGLDAPHLTLAKALISVHEGMAGELAKLAED